MNFIVDVLGLVFIILSFLAVIAFWRKVAASLGDMLGFSRLIDFIIKKLSGE
ncbi:MAG: hypothetical protein WBA54_12165 [Acidaminobacteraceae bacterium]